MRPQPLIAVADVEASSRWYQRLLDCTSGHGGPLYEQLLRGDEMVMQLQHWRDEDHPNLGDPDAAPHGYGVLLWFQCDEFDAALAGSGPRSCRDRSSIRTRATAKSGRAIPTATSSSSPASAAISVSRPYRYSAQLHVPLTSSAN